MAAMPFDYYDNLSARQQVIYRKSDSVTDVQLPDAERLAELADRVRAALETDRVRAVQRAVADLGRGLVEALNVAPATIKVLARRPNRAGEELHGIYEREEGQRPRIQVWMRTAAKKRTVSFRTFLRTFLHELCHHLDYELLGLTDTFHTEGFFKRESSLMRALVPPAQQGPEQGSKPKPPPATDNAGDGDGPNEPRQLKLDL